jgi:hypothetical protein
MRMGPSDLEGDTSADVAVRPRNADVTHSVYGVVFPARGFPASAVASGRITAAGPRSLTSINAGPTHLVSQRLRRNPNRRATQATAPLDSPLSPGASQAIRAPRCINFSGYLLGAGML